jgi:hypothetical protein
MQQPAEGVTVDVNRRCGVGWMRLVVEKRWCCGRGAWTRSRWAEECEMRAGEAFEPTGRAKPANEMEKRQ